MRKIDNPDHAELPWRVLGPNNEPRISYNSLQPPRITFRHPGLYKKLIALHAEFRVRNIPLDRMLRGATCDIVLEEWHKSADETVLQLSELIFDHMSAFNINGVSDMTDIITGPGSYRTVDGRRVEIHIGDGDSMGTALNIMCAMRDDPTVRCSSPQVYYRSGSVSAMLPGEENDRIVGPWIDPTSPVQVAPHLVAGNYGIVTVYQTTGGAWRYELTKSTGTPEELRAAARTLIEIADFIDAS